MEPAEQRESHSEEDKANVADKFKAMLDKYVEGRKQVGDYWRGYVDGSGKFACFEDELLTIGIKFITRTSKSRKGQRCPAPLEPDEADDLDPDDGEVGRPTTSGLTGRILFESKKGNGIPYCGIPFTVKATFYRECRFGNARKKLKMEPDEVAELETELVYTKRKKKGRGKDSKKKGCPARMTIKIIHLYEDYAVVDDEYDDKPATAHRCMIRKKFAAQKLIEDLKNQKSVAFTVRYLIDIADIGAHSHAFGNSVLIAQEIHPKLAEKINELVSNGITTEKDVKTRLRNYVQNGLFNEYSVLPDETNSAFYPSNTVIRSHIYMAKVRQRYDKLDHVNLELMINQWKKNSPTAQFLLRQCRKGMPAASAEQELTNVEQSFLLVHQEEWQRQLLAKYGSGICLLDATHKTTQYAVPLYFLTVRTNAGDCVVGEFSILYESSKSIAEALAVLQVWNPLWVPVFFMADHSMIKSIETVFPSASVYLSAYHREQEWMRWCKKQGNLCGIVDQLLTMWRGMASAEVPQQYEEALEVLRLSNIWKDNLTVRRYFTSEWLPLKEKWVHCFTDGNGVNMMNEVTEAQYRLLRNSYLNSCNDKPLSSVYRIIIEQYLPNLQKENELPKMAAYRTYTLEIPDELQNRPSEFIQHTLLRMEAAKEFSVEDIHIVDPEKGVFEIKSEPGIEGDMWNLVSFEEPVCPCEDFRWSQLPCKHFCVIFRYSNWNLNHLPEHYLNSPMIAIDETAVGSITEAHLVIEGLMQEEVSEDVCLQVGSAQTLEEEEASLKQQRIEMDIHLEHDYHLQSPWTTATSECRTLLQEMTSLSRKCHSLSVMDDVNRKLKECQKLLVNAVQEEDGAMLASGRCRSHPQKPYAVDSTSTSLVSGRKRKRQNL